MLFMQLGIPQLRTWKKVAVWRTSVDFQKSKEKQKGLVSFFDRNLSFCSQKSICFLKSSQTPLPLQYTKYLILNLNSWVVILTQSRWTVPSWELRCQPDGWKLSSGYLAEHRQDLWKTIAHITMFILVKCQWVNWFISEKWNSYCQS